MAFEKQIAKLAKKYTDDLLGKLKKGDIEGIKNSPLGNEFLDIVNGKDAMSQAANIGDALSQTTGSSKPVDWRDYATGEDSLVGPIKKYMMTDYVAPTMAAAAKTTGNAIAAKNSILGLAMQALAKDLSAKEGLAGGPARHVAAYGAGLASRGALAGLVGNSVGDLIDTINNNSKNREEKARMTAVMTQEHPNQEYFRAQARLAAMNNK